MVRQYRALAGVLLLLMSALALAEDGANYLVSRDIVYGDSNRPDSELQSLDLYWLDNLKRRPVVIYVHDGAWALGDKSDVHEKPGFFALHDMAFVSMNYRLRWEASLTDQLEDIGQVIAWVTDNAGQYGIDPGRIVLMGHGAGAHLVSLFVSQPDYLDTGDLDFGNIRAVVSIDSASYDIEALMENGTYLDKRQHRLIFGEEARGWRAASPIVHVSGEKQIPPFALLYVPDNQSTTNQTRQFARTLRDAGVDVIMIPGNEKTTETIDEELGSARDAPTLALIAFLRAAI